MNEDDEIPEVEHVPDVSARGARDAPLVERVRAGDTSAFGELYDLWFDRVFDLSYRVLWDEQSAAEVAQDAFLSAWRSIDGLEDPNAFGGWLLRIARNGALDRKRRDQRSRPVDDTQLAMIERDQLRPEDTLGTLDDPLQVAQDASYAAMIWDAAEALGERDREVLDLSLRHGLAPAEIADVVGLNRNAANQLVHRVRNRLGIAIGARMLWRGGQPECAALRAELVEADIERFDADAVRVTDQHAAGCAECSDRRRLRLSPAQLFAAIPIVSIPSLKAKAAHALAAAGVPMEGSRSLAEDPSAAAKPKRGRRGIVASAVGIFVILASLIIGAVALSDDPAPTVAVTPRSTTTSSSTPSSSTTSTSSTSTTSTTFATSTTTTTVAPIVIPPPTSPPTAAPTTTTTTIPRTVTFTLEPDTASTTFPVDDGPLLTWNVTGARRVEVTGENLDESSAKGSERLCPGIVNADICVVTDPGPFVYTLDAFDAQGRRFAHRTLTLTMQ